MKLFPNYANRYSKNKDIFAHIACDGFPLSPGAINFDFHCDKLKGKQDVTFDLYSDSFFTTLTYGSRKGNIKSSDSKYDQQINSTLNLNNKLLMANRLFALNGVVSYLNKYGWTTTNYNKLINIWDHKDAKGYYNEYCGIVVWFLKQKLKQKV